jgi:CheY-like chemotaxis protein
VLIVENEAIVAADVQERLAKLGYKVAAITDSGPEAVALAAQLKPALVLMDILLSGPMRGTEAAGRITGEYKIPVVYLTANADDQTFFAAVESAPFGFVLKPFDDRELQIAIEIALYKHRLEREREELIAQLQEALAQVSKLSTLLPICAWCKRVRDDQGYWTEVQSFLDTHTTHSACPECAAKMMAEVRELAAPTATAAQSSP